MYRAFLFLTPKVVKITLPRWVEKRILNFLKQYLETDSVDFLKRYKNDIHTIQQMLWISDFFQLQSFQGEVIEKIIIPGLNRKNSTIYLNEAFKKLKAS